MTPWPTDEPLKYFEDEQGEAVAKHPSRDRAKREKIKLSSTVMAQLTVINGMK
jgi:hypothetical protein